MSREIILIVEDDNTSCEFFKELLEREKIMTYVIVKNGEEAIRICKDNESVSLILMDLKLPGIDGCETLKRIRKFNKAIPIIAQTACAMEGDKEKYLDCGFDEYITKPIDTKRLLNIIYKYHTHYSLN